MVETVLILFHFITILNLGNKNSKLLLNQGHMVDGIMGKTFISPSTYMTTTKEWASALLCRR
jgi:hypothetical protein